MIELNSIKHSFYYFIIFVLFSGITLNAQETTPPTNTGTNTTNYRPIINNGTTTPDGDKTKNGDPNNPNNPNTTTENPDIATNEQYEEDQEKVEVKDKSPLLFSNGLPIFGSDAFGMSSVNYAPNTNIPIPYNYIIGPGDILSIDVTGMSLVNWSNLKVQPDGAIMIPTIGKVYVGSHTYDEAVILIKNKLRANRFAVDRGTNVDVSLDNIRSINISIIGEVRNKGNFTISSLSTVFNALNLSGGLNANGSYRNVQLIRDNGIYATIDLYDYLLRGDMSSDFTLQDGDIIFIPVYDTRIAITGEVKRPALYEMKPNERLKDVIDYAGGFTEFAYSNHIKVTQYTDKEQRIRTIPINAVYDYIPQNGDKYQVDRILERFENRVTIKGAVFRPGEYELEIAKSLKGLINLAEGLKEEAYLNRGYLTRINDDNSSEQISFDVKALMEGKQEDIALKREDIVTIGNLFDLTDSSNVRINGYVRNPGTFSYYRGMTVEDLILSANGFTDGANYQKIEIARRVKDSDRKANDAKMAEIITISVDPYLKLSDNSFLLEPSDIVSVFALTGYVNPITASIEGAIMLPGPYTLTQKNIRISDLVNRSGGVTDWAYVKGASLMRIRSSNTITQNELALEKFKESRAKKINVISEIQSEAEISKKEEAVIVNNEEPVFVAIDLEYIMKHPGSVQDLILKDGDRLSIPETKQTVKISGEVQGSIIATYKKNKSLKNYIIDDAGGFTEVALKRKTYVVYANGQSKGKKFFGGFPKIEPGAEIIVPYKAPKEKGAFSTQAVIALTTSVATAASVIYAIFKK